MPGRALSPALAELVERYSGGRAACRVGPARRGERGLGRQRIRGDACEAGAGRTFAATALRAEHAGAADDVLLLVGGVSKSHVPGGGEHQHIGRRGEREDRVRERRRRIGAHLAVRDREDGAHRDRLSWQPGTRHGPGLAVERLAEVTRRPRIEEGIRHRPCGIECRHVVRARVQDRDQAMPGIQLSLIQVGVEANGVIGTGEEPCARLEDVGRPLGVGPRPRRESVADPFRLALHDPGLARPVGVHAEDLTLEAVPDLVGNQVLKVVRGIGSARG